MLNVLLSILSVGTPVWFAWLATKQIGQRFRLAEDYAFKASIARAYEGFRREAARFDENMESKVLTSASTRLDELPLGLVEERSYGSPWHELASFGVIDSAMKSVPGFGVQTKELARRRSEELRPPCSRNPEHRHHVRWTNKRNRLLDTNGHQLSRLARNLSWGSVQLNG